MRKRVSSERYPLRKRPPCPALGGIRNDITTTRSPRVNPKGFMFFQALILNGKGEPHLVPHDISVC